ncbi:alpha/beta hydrolase [Micromonospora sp. NBC_01699]|uniref:alpha/beta fold hydrolase n=1 Tax=Micromonospora sp. NBC_01699 TaxID=2975984 RepID=UPI002E2C770B|nr:alpha/beta hydrolase [Micromonospora sp. NBC_01699]
MRLPAHRTGRWSRAIATALCALTIGLLPLGSANTVQATGMTGTSTHPDTARIPAGFSEQKEVVNGIRINYVRGGHGPTLVLLHGFPETWYTWRKVLPALAAHYTVIAPDLPGSGRSDAPAAGYDKLTLAADIHGLLTKLGLSHHIRLVGHDIGSMVAYAYAAAHPTDVDKLVLSEAPIPDPSIYTFASLTADGPAAWNFGYFNLTNGLPEQLIRGREALWVQLFTDSLEVQKNGIGPAEVNEFARYLRDPAHLRASFEYFRTFDQDIVDNAVNINTKLTMPVLAIGASGSLRDFVPTQVARYATNVTGALVDNSGHWIYEEQPAEMTQLLLRFLG